RSRSTSGRLRRRNSLCHWDWQIPEAILRKNMAASMYIVVEGEDPGYDIFVNGRALERYDDALERVALRLGVKLLIEIFSADVNSMSLLIEEGAGNADLIRRLPPPQWYSPADGLT